MRRLQECTYIYIGNYIKRQRGWSACCAECKVVPISSNYCFHDSDLMSRKVQVQPCSHWLECSSNESHRRHGLGTDVWTASGQFETPIYVEELMQQ